MRDRSLKYKSRVLGLVVAALIVVAVVAFGQLTQPAENVAEAAFKAATVERVVDGDTLIVHVDGERQRCRLVGMDCPEAGTEDGDAATSFTESLVKPGQTVFLQKDVSETDQYDRLLRYVWLEIPDSDSIEEIEIKMLNGIIIKNGYAVVKRYAPDTKYYEVFKEIAESS